MLVDGCGAPPTVGENPETGSRPVPNPSAHGWVGCGVSGALARLQAVPAWRVRCRSITGVG